MRRQDVKVMCGDHGALYKGSVVITLFLQGGIVMAN